MSEKILKTETQRKNIGSKIDDAQKNLALLKSIPPKKRTKSNKDAIKAAEEVLTNETLNMTAFAQEFSDTENEFQKAFADFAEACSQDTETATKVGIVKMRRVELIDLSKQDWGSFKEMVNKMPAPLLENEMRNDFKNFNEYYAKVVSLASIATSKANGDVDKINMIDNIKKSLKEGFNNINEDGFLGLIRDVIVLQVAMENEKSFTVSSPPIQIDGDFIVFKVKATPARANDLLNYISEKAFPIELPIKGGLKADFSLVLLFHLAKIPKTKNIIWKMPIKPIR